MSDPLIPEEAAKKIVADLLSDLSTDRQDAVRKAIERWGTEWADLIGSVAHESARYEH